MMSICARNSDYQQTEPIRGAALSLKCYETFHLRFLTPYGNKSGIWNTKRGLVRVLPRNGEVWCTTPSARRLILKRPAIWLRRGFGNNSASTGNQ